MRHSKWLLIKPRLSFRRNKRRPDAYRTLQQPRRNIRPHSGTICHHTLMRRIKRLQIICPLLQIPSKCPQHICGAGQRQINRRLCLLCQRRS